VVLFSGGRPLRQPLTKPQTVLEFRRPNMFRHHIQAVLACMWHGVLNMEAAPRKFEQ